MPAPDPVRIVSLLPSATEIVCALGLRDELVGITHECDWPPEVAGIPVMTSNALDLADASSREIHRRIGDAVHGGSAIYRLDERALEAADPDLILTQELCAVCAVGYREVSDAVRSFETEITVVSLEPTSIEGILNTISTVGAMADAEDAAVELVESLRARLGRSRRRRRSGARVASADRVSSPSNGSTHRSPWATGCPIRSAVPAAGISSAMTASRPDPRPGTRSPRLTRTSSS
jgi:iron complex transport system substrate-binding protein